MHCTIATLPDTEVSVQWHEAIQLRLEDLLAGLGPRSCIVDRSKHAAPFDARRRPNSSALPYSVPFSDFQRDR